MPHLASEIRERLPEHLIKTTSMTLPEWKGVRNERVCEDMTCALAVIDTSRSMRSAFELSKQEAIGGEEIKCPMFDCVSRSVSLVGEDTVWQCLQRCEPVLRHLGHISTETGKCYATLSEFESRKERDTTMLVMPIAKGFGHLVLRYEVRFFTSRQN